LIVHFFCSFGVGELPPLFLHVLDQLMLMRQFMAMDDPREKVNEPDLTGKITSKSTGDSPLSCSITVV
jgi:hypothetical protein